MTRVFQIHLCLDPTADQMNQSLRNVPGPWHFIASLMGLVCKRAEDSAGTIKSYRRGVRKAVFEEWRLLMESLPFWARSFGLGPMRMRVLFMFRKLVFMAG